VYDARTDQISELGLQYGTKPGFYMVVGPTWNDPIPSGECRRGAFVRRRRRYHAARLHEDTPEDHAAIQPALNEILSYPMNQFDGQMKTKGWSKRPVVNRKGAPAKYSSTQPPWVDPATFFETSRTERGAGNAK
jgi:hypothetical protein